MSKTSREFDRVARTLKKYSDKLGDGAGDYVEQVAHTILTDVRMSRPGRGVPRDEGTLANSGRVSRVSDKRSRISFGGAAAPYALVQHERTDFRHDLGEARYLVRGVERWRPGGEFKRYKEYAEDVARRFGTRT